MSATADAAVQPSQRTKLLAPRNYYVRADGEDSNDGLTNSPDGAFLTIQKAIDTIADTIDLGGFGAAVLVQPGIYTKGAPLRGGAVGRKRGRHVVRQP